jgi:hypothetical protein
MTAKDSTGQTISVGDILVRPPFTQSKVIAIHPTKTNVVWVDEGYAPGVACTCYATEWWTIHKDVWELNKEYKRIGLNFAITVIKVFEDGSAVAWWKTLYVPYKARIVTVEERSKWVEA